MPRIIYVQYTNPAGYPPLEHSSRILADAGWQVLFLGTGSLGSAKLVFPPHPAIEVRRLSFRPPGWCQKFHYAWFCLWCFGWVLKRRPNWIYASDALSCPVALLLNVLLKIPMLYHEHDSPSTESSGWFARVCLAARKACAHRATLCLLPNRQRAEKFAAETEIKRCPEVVWNCPSRREAIGSDRESRPGLRLLYHGSIVPDRMPLTVIDALATLPDDACISIVGYETSGSIGYIRELRHKATKLGISHRVEVLGSLALRSELLDVARSCDVGLALMPSNTDDLNLQAMTGASNKPFDYLACGLAVLVSDLPDWREMYIEPRYGLCCDPDRAESIATALRWFHENAPEREAMGERGRLRVSEDWNYEKQFFPVLNRLERIHDAPVEGLRTDRVSSAGHPRCLSK